MARAFAERFYSKSKFGKRRNTVCISSFTNCRIGGKDPAKAADTIMQDCPIGELVRQAERKSSTSTLIPDLYNANVGTYMIVNLREILWYLPFYVAI